MSNLNYSYYTYNHANWKVEYKIYDGTAYHIDTPDNLVLKLESIRQRRERVIIELGDVKTKKPWWDIETGYIWRSTGPIKIPICIYNSRSMGWGSLLDNCILSIKTSLWKHTLYSI